MTNIYAHLSGFGRRMKAFVALFTTLFLLLSAQSLFAEANYVYHEQTTNNPGCGPNYMSTTSPNSATALQISWKVEYQFYTTNTVVYYTTDGSNPSGAFGVGAGTTQVLTGSYNCTFGGPVVDVATATIPAQPAGTTVKYIISAWHSGGGAEIFANGPGAPCGCGTPTSNSGLATIFQYTVTPSATAVEVYGTSATLYGGYSTLSAAFGAINAGTHQGAIKIRINANTTEPATATALLRSASPSNYISVNIRPYGNVTVNSASLPTGSRGVIELNGADNVTIDGDDPFTAGTRNLSIVVATSTTTGIAAVRLSSNSLTGTDGADNNTIKNCNITGSRSSATSTTTSYGIVMSNSSSITTGAYSSVNTVIENNVITRCYHGIYANGTSSTYPNTGTQIKFNTLGSATSADNIGSRGIFISYSAVSTGSALIHGNDIRVGDYGATGYSATIAGIEVGTVNYGITISNNYIHDINQPTTSGYGAHGIYITGSTNNTLSYIYNNFIRDCKMVVYQTSKTSTFIPNGVFFTAGATGVNFNYNTIVMNPQLGAGVNYSSFCVNASVSGVTFTQFQNNILVNNHVSTNAYGFNTAATTNISGGAINNNDYYVPGGHVGYYSALNRTTLADWRSATGKDAASYNISPLFVSATDLHLQAEGANTSLDGTGVVVAGITTDYDGALRNATTPDIGADEFALPVCTASDGGTITPASASTCAGLTYSMSSVGASFGLGITYQWEVSTIGGGVGFIDVTGGTGATTTSYTTGSLSAGTYYYRLKVTCTPAAVTGYSNELVLTVNPTPTATASSNSPVCEGEPINLLGTTDIGTAYNWTGPGGYTSSSEDPTIPVAALTNAGVYSFTASADGCTSNVATTTVVVNANPSGVTATATPGSLCEGATLALSAAANPLDYVMNPAGTASFIDIFATGTSVGTLGDDTEHNFTIPSFNYNGVVYATARVGTNGVVALGSTSGEISLSNGTLPTTSNSAGNVLLLPWWDDLDIQMGATIKYETVGSIFVIQFSNIAHNNYTTGDVTYQIQLDLTTGTIHFVYSDVIFGSATYDAGLTATVGIQFSSSSAIQYSFNTASLSNGQCITFTPSLPTFSWTGPDGFTSAVQNPTIPAATAAASGVYTVVVTNAATGCSTTTSTSTVTVTPNTTYYADADSDTYGDAAVTQLSCTGAPVGYVLDNTDCDDASATVNPGATEICGNGIDDDCDGSIDELCTLYTFYEDFDTDTYGNPAVSVTNYTGIAPAGYVADNTDCDDTNAAVNPAATEICNGIDDDCDGSTDEGVLLTFYADADSDTYGDAATTAAACTAPVGYVANSNDCDDTDGTINPGATETCNGVDDDCDGFIDEAGATGESTWFADADSDGYGDAAVSVTACVAPGGYVGANDDCDDTDAAINPGATEICDGIDNDCDGSTDEGVLLTFYADADSDTYGDAATTTLACSAPTGYVADNTDCNDGNASVNPAATEICNGIDDDCDGSTDEGVLITYYEDLDADGFGAIWETTLSCTLPAGYAILSGDCDDLDPIIYPGAPELCDGNDNDCDGSIDEGVLITFYADADGDSFGDAASTTQACSAPTGFVADNTDCDDTNAAVNPGATEICNGIDDDCDGSADEGVLLTFYADTDDDTYGDAAATTLACSAPTGFGADNTDCDDSNAAVNPGATEVCNGMDDDCNGLADDGLTFVDYYTDADGDGYGDATAIAVSSCSPVAGSVTNNDDCDDSDVAINPAATEVCDGIDNDCDGIADDGLTFLNYYADADSDGYGDAGALPVNSCSPIAGSVTNNGDCNDANAAINPGATEICDGIDNDCDGSTDEGVLLTFYADADGDTYGDAAITTLACSAPTGYVADDIDCNDGNASINPGAAEVCNGVDDDCDGSIDEGLTFVTYYADADGDGYGNAAVTTTTCDGAPAGYVSNADDCDDTNTAVNPAATEICNGIDDDCDGSVDEGLVFTTYYADADGDGFGDAFTTTTSCDGIPTGYVTDNTDCDDTQNTVYPGATEICDGLDNDCDGDYDEGTVTATVTPSGVITICRSVPTPLTANTGVGYTYQWFKNGNVILGATSSVYNVTKPGYYQVQVNIPEGCFALSEVTTVQVYPNPNANISAPNGTSLCTSVKLKASYDVSYTWQWLNGGTPIPGATSYLYFPTSAGNYSCAITNTFGCSRTTATIAVTACKEGEETTAAIEESFELYPNPAESEFTLDMELNTTATSADVIILNMVGAQVFAGNVGIDNGTIFTTLYMDDSTPAGMYIVKVLVADKEYTKQLVIQK